ncbi:MAG: hypothetical protein J3K34DRAFT_517830 [Monoraphidium minutum]|nr:MAG: hypothetical protein J3K34DRAFT_517830 [Monoraphidium minutum]
MGDQEDKLKAFRAHDFDGDADWQAYLSRVEIPSNSPADLLKAKAKWWRREKDPDFDAALAAPPPAAAPQPTPQQQQPRPSPAPPQQQQQGSRSSYARPPPAAAANGGGAGPAWLPNALMFADVLIVVCTVLYLLPLFPALSGRAYRVALLLCFVTHLAYLTKQVGPLPAGLQALQQWAVRALPSTHFSYAVTALMFLTGAPVSAVLPPFAILALYSATSHAAARHAGHPLWASRGAALHAYLTANRQKALHLAAQLEISLGVTMVVKLLFPGRSFILTLFVWQQLRLRYWSPEAGAYHRAAWAGIDQLTAPLRASAPALAKPVAFMQRWFQSGHPMGAGGAR